MGNIEFEIDLMNFDFVKYVEVCGGIGYCVENLDELFFVF